jgi:molybdopterin converting factor small subunit
VKVQVRLFAGLRDNLPDAVRGRAELDLPEDCSLQELLDRLEIHEKQAQMVLVNGVQASRGRAARETLTLLEGDDVAIFPPLAGG